MTGSFVWRRVREQSSIDGGPGAECFGICLQSSVGGGPDAECFGVLCSPV